MTQRKLIISISGILLALVAVVTVFLVLNAKNKPAPEKPKEKAPIKATVETVPQEEPEPEVPPVEEVYTLAVSCPVKNNVYTNEKDITLAGSCKPNTPITINGIEVMCDENGAFSYPYELKVGKNTFTFAFEEQELVYTVNYRYVIIESYYPSNAQTFSSGATLFVSANARKGSTVTAELNGTKINLTLSEGADSPEGSFVTYKGSFSLPSGNTSNINLGKVKFTASYGGNSESFYSGNITCKKYTIPVEYDPNQKPLSDRYLNVGTGKIAEIVDYEAETFDPYSTDDWSRPTNNYLPKGTVDYAAEGHVYSSDSASKKEYVVLRCGKQVYLNRVNTPKKDTITVTKEYAGTLPDHNEIEFKNFENGTSHTTLTVGSLWKAPFYFDLLEQNYINPSKQNYMVSDVTYNYVDITFCYASVYKGTIEIPEGNPIFKDVTIFENKDTDGNVVDITLRLYLKKQGAFYGWDSEYDENGNLVFSFLNPRKVTATTENSYGADLTGAVILIDVGHGGSDAGALGFDGKNHNEAIQNLILAKKIKRELENIGATVYMTRESNVDSTNDDKIKMLKELKPDYCICIHHNAFRTESSHGFGAYYSQPFAHKATEFVYNHTSNLGNLYKKYFMKWHYYYMARSSYCPVVLTENGFISNRYDYSNIIDDAANDKKAEAIVKGIAEYFLYINK